MTKNEISVQVLCVVAGIIFFLLVPESQLPMAKKATWTFLCAFCFGASNGIFLGYKLRGKP